jgi:hypothetical protein
MMVTVANWKQQWGQWQTEDNNGNSGKLITMIVTVANWKQ